MSLDISDAFWGSFVVRRLRLRPRNLIVLNCGVVELFHCDAAVSFGNGLWLAARLANIEASRRRPFDGLLKFGAKRNERHLSSSLMDASESVV